MCHSTLSNAASRYSRIFQARDIVSHEAGARSQLTQKAALIFIVLGCCGTFTSIPWEAKAQIASNQESPSLEKIWYKEYIFRKNVWARNRHIVSI